jgi:hypothetical protein
MHAHTKSIILVSRYSSPQALLLSHPFPSTRDTQQFAYKYKLSKGRRPALRNLTAQEFGIQIQGGEHSSVRLILFAQRVATCVFTFPCRSQTPEPRWRYTVSTVANGKRGGRSSYHRSKTPIVRTPPEHGRNGNAQTGVGTTIHPAAGRKVEPPARRRVSNVWTPQK